MEAAGTHCRAGCFNLPVQENQRFSSIVMIPKWRRLWKALGDVSLVEGGQARFHWCGRYSGFCVMAVACVSTLDYAKARPCFDHLNYMLVQMPSREVA